jgi:hypothetical protein
MATLDRELEGTEKFSEPPSLSGRDRTIVDFITLQLSRVSPRMLLGLLVVLLLLGATIGALVTWNRRNAPLPQENVGEGLHRPRSPQPGETLPVPPPSRRP